jgi:poly-gamma-glutamate capsule biosynthesis protein CapA/YwtB (metallophosphatase superfamily)
MMAAYDREAARANRSERHRAAKRARRRMALVSAGICVAVLAVAGAAYAGFVVLSRTSGASRDTAAPAIAPVAFDATVTVEATVTPPPSTEPTYPPTITIAAVGDMLFDLSPRNLIASKGGRAPLVKVEGLLNTADVTIGNLEGPLSNRGTHVGGKTPDHIFAGDPRAVEGLTASGFDLLALANNHIMDHGGDALTDTLATLDGAGIGHAGAGMDKASAWAPAIIERNGKKIAYLSFSQIVPGGFTPTSSRPGMATGRDMHAVTAAIAAARQQADYVIVSYHWGVEQSYAANASQKRDGRASIDAGADMVLSHHPHVMQGIEFYKGKLIAYSLGDFIFPYKTVEGRKSIILRASLGPDGVTDVSALPVYMADYGRPVPQTGSSARGILTKLRDISAPLGTKVVIEGDTARILPE